MEVIKNNHIEILEWKVTIIEINLLEGLNIRFEITEERISKFEWNRLIEIIQSEKQQNPKIYELTELKNWRGEQIIQI